MKPLAIQLNIKLPQTTQKKIRLALQLTLPLKCTELFFFFKTIYASGAVQFSVCFGIIILNVHSRSNIVSFSFIFFPIRMKIISIFFRLICLYDLHTNANFDSQTDHFLFSVFSVFPSVCFIFCFIIFKVQPYSSLLTLYRFYCFNLKISLISFFFF